MILEVSGWEVKRGPEFGDRYEEGGAFKNVHPDMTEEDMAENLQALEEFINLNAKVYLDYAQECGILPGNKVTGELLEIQDSGEYYNPEFLGCEIKAVPFDFSGDPVPEGSYVWFTRDPEGVSDFLLVTGYVDSPMGENGRLRPLVVIYGDGYVDDGLFRVNPGWFYDTESQRLVNMPGWRPRGLWDASDWGTVKP